MGNDACFEAPDFTYESCCELGRWAYANSRCFNAGNWSYEACCLDVPPPVCVGIQCMAAGSLGPQMIGGSASNEGMYPSVLVYACESGYTFDAETIHQNQTSYCSGRERLSLGVAGSRLCARRECGTSGGWGQPRPSCTGIVCQPLSPPEHGHVFGPTNVGQYPSSASYGCEAGYRLEGPGTRTCSTNGAWVGVDSYATRMMIPRCVGVPCTDPPNVDDSRVSLSNGGLYPTTASYSCRSGFILLGGGEPVCNVDGTTWSGETPECFGCGSGCPICAAEEPELLPANVISSCHQPHVCCGTTCVLSCGLGYSGQPVIRSCSTGGLWAGEYPVCAEDCLPYNVSVGYSAVQLISNSSFNETDFDFGSDSWLYSGENDSAFATVPHGTEYAVACAAGYIPVDALLPAETIACTIGTYADLTLECTEFCEPPTGSAIQAANQLNCTGRQPLGATCMVSCGFGHTGRGVSAECQPNNTWSSQLATTCFQDCSSFSTPGPSIRADVQTNEHSGIASVTTSAVTSGSGSWIDTESWHDQLEAILMHHGALVNLSCLSGLEPKHRSTGAPLPPVESHVCTNGSWTNPVELDCVPPSDCIAGTADLDHNGRTPCVQCSSGFHAPRNGYTCIACSPGTADTDSDASTHCEACLPGTFAALQASIVCAPCELGRADLDLNPVSQCEQCASGFYSASGQTVCSACVAGFADRDENASTPCAMCEAGYYSNSVSTVCLACAAGTEALSPQLLSCNLCAAGRADLDTDSTTVCDACLEGHYSPPRAVTCTACAPGMIDDDRSAATPCANCSVGFYSPQAALVCIHCLAGYHDHDLDPSTPCNGDEHLCPAGSFSGLGSTSCEHCAAGFADLDTSANTTCVPCSPRTHTNGTQACTAVEVAPSWTASVCTGATTCLECVAGWADHDSDAATLCVPCATGTHSPNAALSCQSCSPGRADTDVDASTPCARCNPGYFSGAAATRCEICPAGSVDFDGNASTPCDSCAVGFYSPAGSMACSSCAIGQADSDSDPSSPCIVCSPGYFTPAESSACLSCPPGRVDGDLDGSTPCVQCFVGFEAYEAIRCRRCLSGQADDDENPASVCVDCEAGYYSNDTAIACVSCKAGQADDDLAASTACVSCEAGTMSSEASTICHECPEGSYSYFEAANCTSCIPGFADDDSDASTPCLGCHNGTFSEWHAVRCTTCSRGTFSGETAPSCTECESGTADHDSDAATPCAPCAAGTHSPNAALSCQSCSPGRADTDMDASTPCEECQPGTFVPCFAATVCAKCPSGTADTDRLAVTPCVNCTSGFYTASGQSMCSACVAGWADLDSDPATVCDTCGAGHYTAVAATVCPILECEPFNVRHGTVNGSTLFRDRFEEIHPHNLPYIVTCVDGFAIDVNSGPSELRCTGNSSWDSDPPACIPLDCRAFTKAPSSCASRSRRDCGFGLSNTCGPCFPGLGSIDNRFDSNTTCGRFEVELTISVTVDDLAGMSDHDEVHLIFAALAFRDVNMSIDDTPHGVSTKSFQQTVSQIVGGLPGVQSDYHPSKVGAHQIANALRAALRLPSLDAITVDGGCECTGCFWPDSAAQKPAWWDQWNSAPPGCHAPDNTIPDRHICLNRGGAWCIDERLASELGFEGRRQLADSATISYTAVSAVDLSEKLLHNWSSVLTREFNAVKRCADGTVLCNLSVAEGAFLSTPLANVTTELIIGIRISASAYAQAHSVLSQATNNLLSASANSTGLSLANITIMASSVNFLSADGLPSASRTDKFDGAGMTADMWSNLAVLIAVCALFGTVSAVTHPIRVADRRAADRRRQFVADDAEELVNAPSDEMSQLLDEIKEQISEIQFTSVSHRLSKVKRFNDLSNLTHKGLQTVRSVTMSRDHKKLKTITFKIQPLEDETIEILRALLTERGIKNSSMEPILPISWGRWVCERRDTLTNIMFSCIGVVVKLLNCFFVYYVLWPEGAIPQVFVRARRNYLAEEVGQLSFNQDEIIRVLDMEVPGGGWWTGETEGQGAGVFPANFVDKSKCLDERVPDSESRQSDTVWAPCLERRGHSAYACLADATLAVLVLATVLGLVAMACACFTARAARYLQMQRTYAPPPTPVNYSEDELEGSLEREINEFRRSSHRPKSAPQKRFRPGSAPQIRPLLIADARRDARRAMQRQHQLENRSMDPTRDEERDLKPASPAANSLTAGERAALDFFGTTDAPQRSAAPLPAAVVNSDRPELVRDGLVPIEPRVVSANDQEEPATSTLMASSGTKASARPRPRSASLGKLLLQHLARRPLSAPHVRLEQQPQLGNDKRDGPESLESPLDQSKSNAWEDLGDGSGYRYAPAADGLLLSSRMQGGSLMPVDSLNPAGTPVRFRPQSAPMRQIINSSGSKNYATQLKLSKQPSVKLSDSAAEDHLHRLMAGLQKRPSVFECDNETLQASIQAIVASHRGMPQETVGVDRIFSAPMGQAKMASHPETSSASGCGSVDDAHAPMKAKSVRPSSALQRFLDRPSSSEGANKGLKKVRSNQILPREAKLTAAEERVRATVVKSRASWRFRWVSNALKIAVTPLLNVIFVLLAVGAAVVEPEVSCAFLAKHLWRGPKAEKSNAHPLFLAVICELHRAFVLAALSGINLDYITRRGILMTASERENFSDEPSSAPLALIAGLCAAVTIAGTVATFFITFCVLPGQSCRESCRENQRNHAKALASLADNQDDNGDDQNVGK